MPNARRLPPVVFALLAFVTGSGASVMAQTPPVPAKAPPAGDIAFYPVHGDPDACGHGCSEWIAADGQIDAGAAQRLRRLLAKLGGRKPTIFFHSPGGQILGSIELGQLIREQKLTVSVGHSIPRGCDRDKPADKACEALKRSGQELTGELDPEIALCASACVYALAGGSSRLVPPWVKLGVHDIGFDPDKKVPRGAPIPEVKRILHDKIQNYLRDMGFDKQLLAAASAVPNESIKFLERDDVMRFGIDRREFGEAAWYFSAKPAALIMKGFFARAVDASPPHHRNGLISLTCVEGRGILLAVGEEHLPADPTAADALPVQIAVHGKEIELSKQIISPELDLHAALIPAGMLDTVDVDATISLSGLAEEEDGSARDLMLSLDGFSAIYARLRENCNAPMAEVITTPPARSAALAPKPGNGDATPATAEPETIELTRTAAAEQRLRLDSIRQDCSIGPMTVSIVEKPQHGAVTIENVEAILCSSTDTLVFYRPGTGYVGADSITLKITYPLGVAAMRHYAIQVR